MFALNHANAFYRAIFRARYNVAVTCVVALTPEQHVGQFCFFSVGNTNFDRLYTTLQNKMMTWRGRWRPHSGRRWSGRSWPSLRKRPGTSCPRTQPQSQTLGNESFNLWRIKDRGLVVLEVKGLLCRRFMLKEQKVYISTCCQRLQRSCWVSSESSGRSRPRDASWPAAPCCWSQRPRRGPSRGAGSLNLDPVPHRTGTVLVLVVGGG